MAVYGAEAFGMGAPTWAKSHLQAFAYVSLSAWNALTQALAFPKAHFDLADSFLAWIPETLCCLLSPCIVN